jgi:hypothetical protein
VREVERWLEPRLQGVPALLRERILEAVNRETEEVKRDGDSRHASRFTLHQRLEALGKRLLAEAIALPPCHQTAVTLLAADALMTFACEALAESHPEALADFGASRAR